MRSFQDKVLGLLQADAEAAGLEVVQEEEYGNKGRVLAQHPDEFSVVAWFNYQFNSTGNGIYFDCDPFALPYDTQGRCRKFNFQSTNSDTIDSMRSYWNELLQEGTRK